MRDKSYSKLERLDKKFSEDMQKSILQYVMQGKLVEQKPEQAVAYKIRENDILVSMTGTRRKKDYFYAVLVGKAEVSEKNLYLNQRVGCFRTIDGICHKYLLFALQNEVIKDIIFTKETGTANQGNLGSEDMKRFVYIPLPPYEEQKRIVEKLEKIMSYCEQLRIIDRGGVEI